MRKGEYYETLKDDPRRSKKADEKISLVGAPYHIEALQRAKTSLPDEETRTLPMNKGATKFVNKFVEKAKKLHEEHEKKNAEAAQTEQVADETEAQPLIETAKESVQKD